MAPAVLFVPRVFAILSEGGTGVTEAEKARSRMRQGLWTGPTIYKVPGYVQCNLVVLGKPNAYDFLLYCQRNAKACPLIEVTDPGDPVPHLSAPGADLRTDLPRYRVFKNGEVVGDVTDISDEERTAAVAALEPGSRADSTAQ